MLTYMTYLKLYAVHSSVLLWLARLLLAQGAVKFSLARANAYKTLYCLYETFMLRSARCSLVRADSIQLYTAFMNLYGVHCSVLRWFAKTLYNFILPL